MHHGKANDEEYSGTVEVGTIIHIAKDGGYSYNREWWHDIAR
jgi:hypothetical protein